LITAQNYLPAGRQALLWSPEIVLKSSRFYWLFYDARRPAKTLPENATEVGWVFKAAFKGGFTNGLVHIGQHVHGML
jgi:hypothetical protein